MGMLRVRTIDSYILLAALTCPTGYLVSNACRLIRTKEVDTKQCRHWITRQCASCRGLHKAFITIQAIYASWSRSNRRHLRVPIFSYVSDGGPKELSQSKSVGFSLFCVSDVGYPHDRREPKIGWGSEARERFSGRLGWRPLACGDPSTSLLQWGTRLCAPRCGRRERGYVLLSSRTPLNPPRAHRARVKRRKSAGATDAITSQPAGQKGLGIKHHSSLTRSGQAPERCHQATGQATLLILAAGRGGDLLPLLTAKASLHSIVSASSLPAPPVSESRLRGPVWASSQSGAGLVFPGLTAYAGPSRRLSSCVRAPTTQSNHTVTGSRRHSFCLSVLGPPPPRPLICLVPPFSLSSSSSHAHPIAHPTLSHTSSHILLPSPSHPIHKYLV